MSSPTTSKSTPGVAPYKGDINVRWVYISGLVLALVTGLSMVLMYWLFNRLESEAVSRQLEVVPATLVTTDKPKTPPAPVLQGAPGSLFELGDPLLEMEAFRRQEDGLLTSTGWVDQNAGTVRIPIEQAKKLLLQRGLPVRPPAER